MRAYKSISAEWAESFASGTSIRLGSFASYREGEKGRADPDEGFAGYRQQQPLATWPGMPEDIRQMVEPAMRKVGVPTAPEGTPYSFHIAAFGNATVFDVPPHHIFCASSLADFPSYGDEETLFEIFDLTHFAMLLRKAAKDQLSGDPQIGLVRYESNLVDPISSDPVRFDPFKKDPQFAEDREIRIVFRPAPAFAKADAIFVRAPRVASLIKRIR